MRESVIDVLFYLFDDLLDEDASPQTDMKEMADQLSEAGFANEDVGRAMTWFMELSELKQFQPPQVSHPPLVRIFDEREAHFIGIEGQDYLLGLLRRGILSNALLEKVIDRALALEEPLDEHTLRWVTAMVVLNVYGRVEDMRALGLEDPAYTGQIEVIQ
ncbi:DUF494 domain-containing protein [Cardiobacteriaceae bacterium TAE3-ERU3]|nr:DUF494 domain-containing protein [Cardiobacteriaceae bacterium TAE3-ERU3]